MNRPEVSSCPSHSNTHLSKSVVQVGGEWLSSRLHADSLGHTTRYQGTERLKRYGVVRLLSVFSI